MTTKINAQKAQQNFTAGFESQTTSSSLLRSINNSYIIQKIIIKDCSYTTASS